MASAQSGVSKQTLFICDLDNSISDSQLMQAFKTEGYKVSYVKLNKNKYQGLNTAFVNFDNEEDAAKALEQLNHLTLGKTELYIVYATEKQAGAKLVYDNSRTVHVKNIPKDIETMVLIKIFSKMIGEVTNLRIMRNKENVPRGYGYITFKNKEDAEKAVNFSGKEMTFEINSKERNFNFIFSPYVAKENRQNLWTNLYVRDYPKSWDDKQLKDFASRYGETTSVVTKYMENLDINYGFSDFKDHESAVKFLELNGKTFYTDSLALVEGKPEEGKETFTLYVRKYMSKAERIQKVKMMKHTCGIFITDFTPEIKLDDINKEFSSCGGIFSSTLYEKPIHEAPQGMDVRYPRALIVFDESGAVEQAQKKKGQMTLNGKELEKGLFVDVYRSHGGSNFGNNLQKRSSRPRQQARHNAQMTTKPSDFFTEEFQNQKVDEQLVETLDLNNIILDYLKEKHPDMIGEAERVCSVLLDIFTPDDLKDCVSRSGSLAQYVETILNE